MKHFAILALGAFALGSPALAPMAIAQSATPAVASQATADFYIANMTCALCPVTVKAAMSKVKGVKSVKVDFPARSAHVVYDPGQTNAAAIAAASKDAGYPAKLKG